MRVLILGIGDAFTRRHYGCSALIDGGPGEPSTPADSRYVLLDCPDPIHRILFDAANAAQWNVDVTDIHDIIVTHLHGDHSNGLESFGFARLLARIKNPAMVVPRIHTNRPASLRLWDKLAPAMDGTWAGGQRRTLADVFDVHVLEPDVPAAVAGLTVRCRFTRHPVPTIGLLLSNGRKMLGWSADTAFDEAHIDWLSQADLIVHECNASPVHTSIDALNALPTSIRRKMRLIHLQDDFDASCTDIPILRQGEVLNL